MKGKGLNRLLKSALDCRKSLLEDQRHSVIRLFNGFLEGWPDLIVELFGQTIVIYDRSKDASISPTTLSDIKSFYLEHLPWLHCILVKSRYSKSASKRKGTVLYGDQPDGQVAENGIWYALDLAMHQDSSLYIDTRNLRKWLSKHAHHWQVLNTFAYTGSLGAACLAGGAKRVIQTDQSVKFLEIAKLTYKLNSFAVNPEDFMIGNFFSITSQFRCSGQEFDCVILDPPFFSSSKWGTIDTERQFVNLINKVRPLIKDQGFLIAINNSLYVQGEDYVQRLTNLGKDGYVKFIETIAVPQDVIGYPETIQQALPVDPAPFNHSTKIAILSIRKKQLI